MLFGGLIQGLREKLSPYKFEVIICGKNEVKSSAIQAQIKDCPEVVFLGFIPNLGDLDFDILLVPQGVRIGSRTRVIEWLNSGKLIVCHNAVAEGNGFLVDKMNCLTGSCPSSLAAACASAVHMAFEEADALVTSSANIYTREFKPNETHLVALGF